jgi:HAD superfamily hydrolase (TIGR01509 family)
MSEIKAVIFDCDGVLVDSEPISNRVLIEMANERGALIDMDYALRYFKGNSLKNCINRIDDLVGLESKEAFETEFRNRSFKAFEKEIQPIKNVRSLLEHLQLPYCVASSGPQHKIELNLRLTGLLSYFTNRIYSCYSIQKWKPEPDVFLWAAGDLKVEPKDCLVIEDSAIGVKAALRGGFKVCAFDAEGLFEAWAQQAHMTVSDMTELYTVLGIRD